ncbi:heat shock 70 kDa protein 4-like [Corticium candelabrum]|uniref:heat shock 70 kDa protein 4-like n=1 Tax=Corticium candelabrum TaxID=121492 RepID=UPI002E2567DC|nr:heat shock 70 kDa protein 4-like [Corticium candelabrum]
MSVVGFDLGYQLSYIAVARAGGIETVANEYSQRHTPSVVAFGEKLRFIGTSAQSQVGNVKNMVWGFKHLIGGKFSDPAVQEEIKRLPFKVVEQHDDRIGIKVTYLGEEQVFSPEQIMSILLVQLKKTAESSLNMKVTDCVVSIPLFFTDAQRRAMLAACKMASINCLRLMNDTTAAALAYGIYKQDLPEASEKPRHVVFVDVGDSSLQVAVCAFNKGKLKVLATAADPSFGGRNFHEKLLTHFSGEFKKKYKIDTLTNPKAHLRLRNECEKLKRLMSANTTLIPMNIECLMDDKDVSDRMKRADFEELCSDLLLRVSAPCKAALQASGLSKSNITAVEIVGGSSRIPAVKHILAEVFGREVSTTLNQDEAVARGCALQCAMLSPTFKVREFVVQDITSCEISLSWNALTDEEEGHCVIFGRNHQLPFSKYLTFHRKEPFELVAQYTSDCSKDVHLGKFIVKNVVPTAEGESSKVKLRAKLDIHGIFKVMKAELYEKLPPEPEPEPEKMETTAESGETGDKDGTGKKDQQTADSNAKAPDEHNATSEPQSSEQETEPPTASDQQETPMTTDEPQTPQPNDNTDNKDDNLDDVTLANNKTKTVPEQQPEAKKPRKPKIQVVSLPIESLIPGLSKSEIDTALEMEGKMAAQDKQEKDKMDAKNAVEEYVYEMRDKLDMQLKNFISEKDQGTFSRLLSSTEDWLYDEGEDQQKSTYIDKLVQLRTLGDPVVKRWKESETRPQAFDDLGRALVHYRKILDLYAQKHELYDHIEETDMKKVQESVDTKQKWMEEKMHTQGKVAVHCDPAVYTSQIVYERENLQRTCDPIINKPKPKVEPPKDEEKPTTDTTNKEGENKQSQPEQQSTSTESKTDEKGSKMDTESQPNKGSNDMDLD